MTDKTRQDSGSTHIIRYALELGLLWIDGDGRDKVREALAALDALEAQLEAIGAGGVSGPLMGRATEGMVGGWIESQDQMPPPGVRVFWGDVDSNRVGYDFWAGDDYRWAPSHWMHIPEFPAPPTTSVGSGKGE